MKKTYLLLLLFLCSASTFAQSKEEQKIRDIFWGSNDAQRKNIEVPEKWKNESAVVLYQEFFYDYHKFAKNVRYTHSIRKRVKLLDKAAVEEYSEFSFVKKFRVRRGYYGKKGKKFLGIKIIKPDGKEKIVEIDEEAIETDEKNEYKIAISGLEVGDIIDYYSYVVEPFKQKYGYTFRVIERTLSDEYPTKQFVLKFNTENDFFINFNSYNGAPKLKEIPTDKSNDRRYILEASDIDKSEFPMWFEPLNELPYYKFQVIFARSGKFEDRIFNHLSDNEKDIKTKVTKDDILELYSDKYGRFKYELKLLKKHLKDVKLKGRDLVEHVYYYLRHYYRNQFIQPSILRESGIDPAAFYYYDDFYFIDTSGRFVTKFAAFLVDYEIPFDVIVGTFREHGPIENLLSANHEIVMLKINFDEPLYLKIFDTHSTLSTLYPSLEGTKAYALSYSYDDKKLNSIQDITIPASTYEDNVSTKDVMVAMNEDFSAISTQSTSRLTGYSKAGSQERLLYFFDFLKEEYNYFKSKSTLNRIKNKKNKKRITNEYKALVNKLKDKQKELFIENAKEDFDLPIEDYEFKILNTGRFEDQPELVYEESFTVNDDVIKKAGPNYIVEIGKFIGGQIEVSEKERDRKADIYNYYARSFNYNISFKIPEGYTVAGIDKLNKSVDNETGAFKSTAVIEGDMLKIQTSKQYKHNFEPNANWAKMIAFLDEANQFTNEKILLKKAK